ncbi:hypothetical protein [uncultured Limnobacter sp.]|uniref:hypothetical protein n=1 Tax=uncultured Limnobacter sp. TaxID=199681 RepID=UPI0030FBAED7
MTTYNTGNPLGSADPKDLFDNAQNLDEVINSTDLNWTDRLGVPRRTLAGAFDDFPNTAANRAAAEAAELGAQTAQGLAEDARDQSQAARDEAQQAAAESVNSTAFRAIPAAYSWAGIYPTICQAPGKAQFSENVSKYARRVYSVFIGAGTIYVDPVNGLDTNSGSASSPVKTISKAVRDLGPSLVLCLPGVYKPFDFRTTDLQGNKLKIVRAVGPCTIEEDADDPNAATWTADGTYPNTYWMPLTPANKDILAVLDTSRLDEEGQPIPLAKYSSILDANASGLGWFHDTAADRLYIRYIGNANLNTVKSRFKIVTGDAASRILVLGTKLLFEGDWQLSGVFFSPLQNAGVRPFLFCEFDPSKYRPNVRHTISHALDSLGADTYFQNAWMHRAKGDNFHYFDSEGVKVRGVEIDCRATYAGDIATELAAPNTSNGSSMHNTGDVLRINGEYRRNYGPDVVDTGTGESWNAGTESGPCTTSGNAYGFYTTGPVMRLDTCSAFGQDQADIAATTGGQILKFATSFRTSSTAGSPVGTIVDYTPS